MFQPRFIQRQPTIQPPGNGWPHLPHPPRMPDGQSFELSVAKTMIPRPVLFGLIQSKSFTKQTGCRFLPLMVNSPFQTALQKSAFVPGVAAEALEVEPQRMLAEAEGAALHTLRTFLSSNPETFMM